MVSDALPSSNPVDRSPIDSGDARTRAAAFTESHHTGQGQNTHSRLGDSVLVLVETDHEPTAFDARSEYSCNDVARGELGNSKDRLCFARSRSSASDNAMVVV